MATVADAILVVMLALAIALLFAAPPDPLFDAVFGACALLGIWLGAACFESSAWQATPGKRLLGLSVTDERGQRISLGRATGRNLVKLIGNTYAYSYLMVLASSRGQAMHDRLQNTLVTRRSRRP
jgi:uncharacterized RDD family membrane protein YckC